MPKSFLRILTCLVTVSLYGGITWFENSRSTVQTVQSQSNLVSSRDANKPVNPGPIKKIVENDTDPCDSELALDSADPRDAAKALEFCTISTSPFDWGLVSAAWVMADGSTPTIDPDYALGHGILPGFGTNIGVRKGDRLLALSSGTARQPTDPGYQAVDPGFDKGYTGNHPDGFPVASPHCGFMCPTPDQPHDDAALEVTLRTPLSAYGLSFDYLFLTTDYPEWVCTNYNDLFIAILNPSPPGFPNGNIAIDVNGSPITANSLFLEYCIPDPGLCHTCPRGTTYLAGTGFEGHGATHWITVIAPVEGGMVITLRFAIYDSGDGALDATVLLDNFQWMLRPFEIFLPLALQ